MFFVNETETSSNARGIFQNVFTREKSENMTINVNEICMSMAKKLSVNIVHFCIGLLLFVLIPNNFISFFSTVLSSSMFGLAFSWNKSLTRDGIKLRPFISSIERGISRRGNTLNTKMLVPMAFEVSKKIALKNKLY